jgi:hypothetical protein
MIDGVLSDEKKVQAGWFYGSPKGRALGSLAKG